MTYCVAISVQQGIVFCSDSRTNAGVDQISTYSKMYRFGNPGERQFVVLAAGNLATTQAVMTQLKNDIKNKTAENLMNVPSIDDAAEYLGRVSLEKQAKYDKSSVHEATFIVGGQITGAPPGVMLVYTQGNHIATSKDTPYLQIGESKYGKPILDRILEPKVRLDTAALCALVSMDSTIRSNLSVGPPVELAIYETDSLILNRHYRLEQDSDYLRDLKTAWDKRLKEAFGSLPPIQWAALSDHDTDTAGNAAS
jgi:putative proteasome-type protease